MSRRSKAPVRSGDQVSVTIDRFAQGGKGVARYEDFVLFVNRAIPGDTVTARVTKVKRSYAEAVAVSIDTPSPSSVTPPCKYVGICGGCPWQRLSYEDQLVAKQELIQEAIQRMGGYDDFTVAPIIPAKTRLIIVIKLIIHSRKIQRLGMCQLVFTKQEHGTKLLPLINA